MFPTCGYFSSFPCPFFVNGLCERPFCHFRHSKHDIEKKEDVSTDVVNYSTAITSSTTRNLQTPALENALTASELNGSEESYITSGSATPLATTLSQEHDASSFSIPSFMDNSSKYHIPIAEEPEQYVTTSSDRRQEQGGLNSQHTVAMVQTHSLPTYLPTPKTPSLPAPQPVQPDTDVPVYQPTPKRELKRRYGDHAKIKSSDMEYDPACNYSCRGLTKSSQDLTLVEENALDYRPTKKKAYIPDIIDNESLHLSYESPTADVQEAASESDEEMIDAQFSEEENDSEQASVVTDEDRENKEVDEEERSEDFENIGDDDISSDDEFIVVPDLLPTKADIKTQKTTLKSEKSDKTKGCQVLEKNKMGKHKISNSEKSNVFIKDRTSVSETSKSSASSFKHKLNSSKAQTDKKLRKPSPHKTSTSTSLPSKTLNQTSLSAVKVHSSDSSHSSSKHLSKKGLELSSEANKMHNKNKKESKLKKSTSSGKKHTSDKHSSNSEKHSLSKKSASAESKLPSSCSKHSSDKNVNDDKISSVKKSASAESKLPSSCSKHSSDKNVTDDKISSVKKQSSGLEMSGWRSSLENKTASDIRRHSSDSTVQNKIASHVRQNSSDHIVHEQPVRHISDVTDQKQSGFDDKTSSDNAVQKQPKRPSSDMIGQKQSSLEDKNASTTKMSHSKSASDVRRHRSDNTVQKQSKQHSSNKIGQQQSSLDDKNISTAEMPNCKTAADRKQSGSGIKISTLKHVKSESKNTSGKHDSSGSKHVKSSSSIHSGSDKKASSSGRHSSSKSNSSREHSHSKSSTSSKKDPSVKTNERSKHDMRSHDSKNVTKNHLSSGQEIHPKHSSSSKNVEKRKSQQSDNEKGKFGKKNVDDSNREKLVEMLNASLFGDDSDDDIVQVPVDISDSDEGEGMTDLHDPPIVEPEKEDRYMNYSNFIHDSDFEDEDIFEECRRIFKEDVPQKKLNEPLKKKLVKDLKSDKLEISGTSSIVPGKKRTAYEAAEQIRKPELMKKEKPRHLLSPAEVMHNRIMEMQRRAIERAAQQVLQEQKVSSTSGSASNSHSKSQGFSSGAEKKRVAHMPKPVTPSKTSKTKASSAVEPTLAITASKTEKRMAHTPNLPNLKRPVIPASFGSKVPGNIRQRYLNLIIDECLKFCASEEEAYKKGLEEEAVVYERSSNKNIYLRLAVNTITRLRSEAKESLPGSSQYRQRRSSLSQSHQATLGGSRAAKISFTLHRSSSLGKKVEVVLTEAELYQKLLKYALTVQQLEENGYPRPSPDSPGKAVILGTRYKETDTLLKGNERTCARCGKRFNINSDGSYVNSEECVYHWTRAYPRKKSGFIQHIYNCCGSDTSSKGCQLAANHVHEQNKRDSLSGFMQTIPRSPPSDGNYGIYALDCEMVYTLGGLELARVTVVNAEGESVLESLVQPYNAVVDYNTKFSGLTAADLKHVDTTLTDIQAILLSRFSDKTILIGHSLESDLFALKLIHSTIVDTSVVFPHRLGPPYKRALKNLMLEIFQKIIQGDDDGHDSKEDAVACLQLMKWRIKEDSKRENRYS